MYRKEGYISQGKIHFHDSQRDRYKCILMYLDVSWCILMYMNGSHQDTCEIHARYMQDTCKIHRIRILITNVPSPGPAGGGLVSLKSRHTGLGSEVRGEPSAADARRCSTHGRPATTPSVTSTSTTQQSQASHSHTWFLRFLFLRRPVKKR